MSATRLKARLTRVYTSSVAGLRSSLSHDLVVDLGTSSTRLYVPGQGLVLNEPTAVAFSLHTGAVEAVGEAAKLQVGRNARSLRVVRPVRRGVIADSEAAGRMLACFIGRALPRRGFWKPHILMVVPSRATGMERRGFEDAAMRAGAGRVSLVEQPLAVAAETQFAGDWRTFLSLDIGAGKTDAAVLCRKGVICATTVQAGLSDLDLAIERHLRQAHGLEIGEATAEMLKMELASALEVDDAHEVEIGGRRAASGMPEKIYVTRAEVQAVVQPLIAEIVGVVRATLDACPPEAAGDLFETGVVLSGGGALLTGMADLLAAETGLQVRCLPNPLAAAALGAGRRLEPTATEADLGANAAPHVARPAANLTLSGAAMLAESPASAVTEMSGAH